MIFPNLKGITKGQVRRGSRNNYLMPVAALSMLFLVGQAYWLSDNRHMFTPFAINRVDCLTCVKVGVIRDPHDSRVTRICPACFGVGYRTVRQFDTNDVLCVPCIGMGRVQEEDGQWRTCRRCDGRGLHRADEWKTITGIDPVTPDPEALQ